MKPLIWKVRHFTIVILLLFGFISCQNGTVFHESSDIEGSNWNEKDLKSFRFASEDSLQAYDFYLSIRNSSQYRYSNLYLFLNTHFPDGQIYSDTIECILANDEGKWTGSGIGSIKENSYLIRRNTRLPLKGEYVFELQQGMRHEILEGIHDIGFKIVRTPDKN